MKCWTISQGAAAILAVIYLFCLPTAAESIAPKESFSYRLPGLCCLPPVLNNFECTQYNGQRYPINLQCDQNAPMTKTSHYYDENVRMLPDYNYCTMPTGPNARTKLMVKCRHRNTTQITNSRKYNDPKVFISGTRQPRQEIAELSNGLRKLRLDMHFLNTSLSSTITNLTIDKDCLEKENILLRKSNWKLSELVKNLTNAKNEEPHPSQVYKPCNLTDGNGCNQDEIPTTTKVLWTQDGHTLTDPTLASEVHLTKEVINNRIRYGNNSKEWLCIYTKGINISFIDGNIDAIGDLNYIQNITDQKFHFNWKLNGQPLTDPAYDSLVIINGKTLRVLLDAYNKMTRVKSYPRIQVLNTAVKVTTTLARDITPLRNPSETISIVDRGYLRYPVVPLNRAFLKAGSRNDYIVGQSSSRNNYGSFGSVTLGHRRSDKLEVAIKRFTYRCDGCDERDFLDLLRHPHIIRIDAYYVVERRYFLVLEASHSDVKFDTKSRSLNITEMLNVATSLLEALKFMHSHRIIHCNIKLHNLLVTADKQIKLCDFNSALTYPYRDGERGTLVYNAPELIRSNWPSYRFGPAIDVYAFGITMIEMLDDIVPNSTQKRTDFLKAIKDANYVSPGVQGVRFRWHKRIFGKYVGKALDINPNKRWTASKLLEAFRELE